MHENLSTKVLESYPSCLGDTNLKTRCLLRVCNGAYWWDAKLQLPILCNHALGSCVDWFFSYGSMKFHRPFSTVRFSLFFIKIFLFAHDAFHYQLISARLWCNRVQTKLGAFHLQAVIFPNKTFYFSIILLLKCLFRTEAIMTLHVFFFCNICPMWSDSGRFHAVFFTVLNSE